MRQGNWRRFARWHIWLGWLTGVPILMWTLSGFAMTLKPIEKVRGEHLKRAIAPQPIPADAELIARLGPHDGIVEVSHRMVAGELIATFTFADGRQTRYSLTRRTAIDGSFGLAQARAIVARDIVGGARVTSVDFFAAGAAPSEFRKPMPAWRVALADGTHVWVGSSTGQIEAIRTRWWRVYDFLWGLHIMDLETREDFNHPVVTFFAGLAAVAALLGCALMFRRRRAGAR